MKKGPSLLSQERGATRRRCTIWNAALASTVSCAVPQIRVTSTRPSYRSDITFHRLPVCSSVVQKTLRLIGFAANDQDFNCAPTLPGGAYMSEPTETLVTLVRGSPMSGSLLPDEFGFVTRTKSSCRAGSLPLEELGVVVTRCADPMGRLTLSCGLCVLVFRRIFLSGACGHLLPLPSKWTSI
jgi:hypothetical protein